ncbi:MAG: hypothetical protein KJO26_05775 [Deltaproteobacteria bacterium]|nr:hypothetical protein [Deltaproteobacteria bacterium]MBT8358939.1 hypothetical protein [Deltaproteobacteria bacterium]MBT8374056.1 hypothetical protein [Deltaproteobacteria bacterium]NNK86542.1 hypothetical protein [Desulfobacterales bacterium]NNL43508.1 hypothetical protein [Desulfobacterales bacterium]
MSNKPRFNFFLSNTKNQVQKDSKLWGCPIPLSLKAPGESVDSGFSYGEYFTAARSFLSVNDCKIIISAISKITNQRLNPSDIKRVSIFQEKHGEFYHPARIETIVGEKEFSFVLNLAVSKTGRSCMIREYDLLQRLSNKFEYSYTPKVYGNGEIYLDDDLKVSLFLGQWFEGYHEFHISSEPANSSKKPLVWDPDCGGFFLSKNQTGKLYRQASMILTLYYDIETFNQIFPWHHAAGDFVIRIREDEIDLKLVTVRQYAPLFDHNDTIEEKEGSLQVIIEAMLVFFLNLSIRMRLDRLDGVGDITWSDDCAVKETVKGFYQALDSKPQVPLIPEPQADFFFDYLSALPESQLYDLCLSIADAYNTASAEVPVIRDQLKSHVALLYHSINS